LKGFVFAIAVVTCMFSPVHAGAEAPDEFISAIVDDLAQRIEGRRDELSADPDTLQALIDEVLLPRFDRGQAAQDVLGDHWWEASEEQRTRFIAAFYSVLLQRYAERLLEFEHDRVEVLPYRGDPTTKKIVYVTTRVDLVDGSNVTVYYELTARDSSWIIINFQFESFSFVGNFLEQYGLEIRDTSLEQLITRLEDEAAGSVDE